MDIVIGITDTTSNYRNYPNWIKGDDKDIVVIQLKPDNIDSLEKCDGVVLTGGIDTHPKYYKNERTNYPHAPAKFNEKRDEFELNVLSYAQEHNIPVLAICRGMQLVNVALGGDLIQDIEESGKKDHRSHGNTDGIHEITVAEDSLLYEIAGSENGTVNSSHHQALGVIAPDMIVSAYSPDGIAEALEWKDNSGKPFLLCVQWHPERLGLSQPENPFTVSVRKNFLDDVRNK